MLLKSLKLKNFRNHREFTCSFDMHNYISGLNGSGKTSILEAINVILQGKSFKNITFSKLINFNSNFFKIDSIVYNGSFESNLSFYYENKKIFKLDNNNIESISKHILKFPTFIYSPENEGFLSNNQIFRRNFLDKITFIYFNEHFFNLNKFNKLLKLKRNVLLNGNIDIDYLDTLNESMINLSKEIIDKRNFIIQKINNNIKILLNNTDLIENFSLKIINSYVDLNLFKNEIKMKRVLSGPHLDKIKYFLNDIEYEKFSSFGQRKSFSLICLNACFLTVEEKLKNDIIFLLDDFEAGLDEMRIDFFKNMFSNHQLIITGVSNTHFKNLNIINI